MRLERLDGPGPTYTSPQGVETRADPTFDGAMNLSNKPGEIPIYYFISQYLTTVGWIEGYNMDADPYDWRLPTTSFANASDGGQYANLKTKLEAMYERTGKPAVALSLSMGGPYFANFLNLMDQDWKDKYIRGFISLAGAYAGTTAATMGITSGLWAGTDDSPFEIDADEFTNMIRSWGSVAGLNPAPEIYGDDPLVYNSATGEKWMASELGDVFEKVGADMAAQAWKENLPYALQEAPGVETWCLYSTGNATVHKLHYSDADFTKVDYEMADGDQTVLATSLRVCPNWASQQTQPVHEYHFNGIPHGDIVYEPTAIETYMRIILDLSQPTSTAA